MWYKLYLLISIIFLGFLLEAGACEADQYTNRQESLVDVAIDLNQSANAYLKHAVDELKDVNCNLAECKIAAQKIFCQSF